MIWRLEYENAHGDVARLDIQRGAATPVEIIEGTENPFLLSYELEDKSKKGFIMSSFADISIYETATFNIDDLKTLDETALSVKWYINSVLEWTGFVVPDFFSRTIGEPGIVNLAASDRLSSLEDATLDGLSEYITLRDLAIACLAKTGLSLPLITTVDFKADTTNIMDVFALSERLEDDKGKKISCFDVLRSILVLTNSTIRQRKGQWRIYNKIQHEAVAPTLNFDEVYQGARRTIQPVLASVGAFQEFGGNRELPLNNSFKNNDSNWAKGGSPLFVTNFDNRDFSFATATSPAVFGQATNQNQLINRNVFNSDATSLSGTPYLKSVDIKVPLEDTGTARTDNVLMTIEINSKSVHQSIAHFAVVRFYDGVVDAYLANNLDWEPFFSTIDINYIQENIRGQGYGVEDITTIETGVRVGRGKDPSKYKIAVYILGVTRAGSPTNRMAAIRSVKITFPESSDFGKGILYRTDQLGNFSKKSNPDTTIFGDFITMGLNGYFYPYRDNDKSALKTVVGSTYSSTTEWTTATDPAAGSLPILQHVTRQMSRMFGVAHNILSAVIDAKTFDPLAIVTNCAGEKYVIVYSVFDFLRSTVEVELQQIAYGSLQRRDFIFSYFGGGDGDGISSIGSVSGGGSSSGGGGGSFLDKYFSFDEANNALVANVNLVSEKEIAAYFADGSIPSIFDNLPFATSAKVGGIKAASTFQNGIRINASGFLEVDPSYADSGVSSWNDLTDRPVWLTPTTKALFEAAHGHTWGQITSKPTTFPPTAHNHTIGNITGLQGALDGYARKGQNETITGRWTFLSNEDTELAINHSFDVTAKDRSASLILGRNAIAHTWRMSSQSTEAWGNAPNLHFEYKATDTGAWNKRVTISSNGNVGINNAAPTEKLHVVGNGLFQGNLTANNGTFTGLKIGANDVATESWIQNTGTAYNSSSLGGVFASDYVRRNVAETITGRWSFNDNVALRGDRNTLALYYNVDEVAKSRVNEIILGREPDFHKWRILNQSTLAHGNGPTLSFQHLGATGSIYADVLTMTYGRNVGINNAAPTERLHVVGNGLFQGNITATGEVTAYSSSDIRLKKNIKTIESAIDTINKLNPVSFNWNKKAIDLNSAKDSDRVNYGVIAQEIERVLPELVHNTNGFKSVDYPQLIVILAKAIQELNLKIK